jgi:hypothetical protein
MNKYIENLILDPTVNRFTDGETRYGIRVLGRGENLFFQENDKALICQIDAVHSIVYSKTIKNWEGEKKMSEVEKHRVIELVEKYYKLVYSPAVKFSDELP